MTLQQMEYVLAVDRFGGGVGNENIRPGTTTGLSDACRSLGYIPGS